MKVSVATKTYCNFETSKVLRKLMTNKKQKQKSVLHLPLRKVKDNFLMSQYKKKGRILKSKCDIA